MSVLVPVVKPVVIDYAPRRQFLDFHRRKQRWAVLVCHRRAGKTVATLNDLIRAAVSDGKPDGRYAFVFPQRNQAKDTAWTYLQRYAGPLLGKAPNQSELRVDLINGAMIRLYGANRPDAMRGPYLDGIVLDEFAQMAPSLWGEVVRPMLADRHGWAIFIGTPKGKNAFYRRWTLALKRPESWFTMMLKASESGILSARELAEMREEENMSPDEYDQEMECSFEAATKGAFYGDEMRTMAAEGRIRPLRIERDIPVRTGWDIGKTDSTAITFWQCVGHERRLVDYYEESGKIITHYADVLYDKKHEHGWKYAEHYWPHDMAFDMLDSEKSRVEMMREKGVTGEIVPAHDVLEGIQVVRKMLSRTWIDPNRCERLIEALRQYRRQWDADLNMWKPGEHKDWTNNPVDSVRTFAVGFDDPSPIKPRSERKRSWESSGVTSWAA